MKHTESMVKIGRRCAFVLVLFSLYLALSFRNLRTFWVSLSSSYHYHYHFNLQRLLLFSFILIYLNFQVAAAVRNRSIEMVEALYNMNRVNQYYSNLFCSLVSRAVLYALCL
jgi:hypothetical protein